jgi:hypothetical protein
VRANPTIVGPSFCIDDSRAGERAKSVPAVLLDPVDPATFHECLLPAGRFVELHRRDYHEYWWFTSGESIVTLWTEATGARAYELGAGNWPPTSAPWRTRCERDTPTSTISLPARGGRVLARAT